MYTIGFGILEIPFSNPAKSKVVITNMPKRRQPSSLKQLCISDITWTFERIWWGDYFDNFGDMQCLHVLGPFDALRKLCVARIRRGFALHINPVIINHTI